MAATKTSKVARSLMAAVIAAPVAFTAVSSLPKPAFGDGCSGGMSWFHRNVLGEPPKWESCCVTHDRAYAKGGTADERLAEDQKLYACVTGMGYPLAAGVMWVAIRPFGHPFFPLPWRWGFELSYAESWQYKRAGAE